MGFRSRTGPFSNGHVIRHMSRLPQKPNPQTPKFCAKSPCVACDVDEIPLLTPPPDHTAGQDEVPQGRPSRHHHPRPICRQEGTKPCGISLRAGTFPRCISRSTTHARTYGMTAARDGNEPGVVRMAPLRRQSHGHPPTSSRRLRCNLFGRRGPRLTGIVQLGRHPPARRQRQQASPLRPRHRRRH